jgi:hypothetical protein
MVNFEDYDEAAKRKHRGLEIVAMITAVILIVINVVMGFVWEFQWWNAPFILIGLLVLLVRGDLVGARM